MALDEGIAVRLDILIPSIIMVHQVDSIISSIHQSAAEVLLISGYHLVYRIGCLIQTPRACLTVNGICSHHDINFLVLDSDMLKKLTNSWCGIVICAVHVVFSMLFTFNHRNLIWKKKCFLAILSKPLTPREWVCC